MGVNTMTQTEIYIVPTEGDGFLFKEFKNSHRGADLLYSYMSKKYMGKPHSYLTRFDKQDFNYRSMFWSKEKREEKLKEEKENCEMTHFWRLYKHESVPIHERILFVSTFEYAMVKRENIPRLIWAMEEFCKIQEDGGHFNLQAQALKEIQDDLNVYAIYWNQCTIGSDLFGDYETDEKKVHKLVQNYLKDGDATTLQMEMEDAYYYRHFNRKKDKDKYHFFVFEKYGDFFQ